MTGDNDPRPSGRQSGILIVTGAILAIAFMSHHPTTHSHTPAEFVDEIGREATLNGIVHGTLIGVAMLIYLGMTGFCWRLGLHLASVRFGLITYSAGGIALVAAALFNGFAVPEFAARFREASPEDLEMMGELLAFGGKMILAVEQFGTVAISVAVAAWSVALLRFDGLTKAVAVLGLIAGGLPVAFLMAGHLPMTVHGFGAVVLAQAIWYLAAAVQLIRGRIS